MIRYITLNYSLPRFLVYVFFILLLGCDSGGSGSSGVGSNKTNADGFIESARFLPTNPKDMTADDCSWFNENQWKLEWEFQLYGNSVPDLTLEQQNITKIEMESLLKTYSYLVFTKPFAVYIQKFFKEHQGNIVSVTASLDDSASPLAIILAYRGINSDSFKDKKLIVQLRDFVKGAENNNSGYTTTATPLIKINETYTDADKNIHQKWDFHATVLKNKEMRINIPFVYKPPNYSILKLPNKDQKFAGQRFSTPIMFHELAHTFWNWGHPTDPPPPKGSKDLTYYTGFISGDLINGWPDSSGQSIITEIIGGGYKSTMPYKIPSMEKYVGGHLPMGLVWDWYPYSAQYSLNVSYAMHHLKKEVFPVELPTTGIGKVDLNAAKKIPADPYPSCINWKTKYLGVTRKPVNKPT